MGAIVDSGPLSLSIPNTFAGVYINLATGANGVTPAAVPGWDFGPYGATNQLAFFFPSTPANSFGGVGSGTAYTAVTVGTAVGPASTFIVSAASAATAAFRAGGTNLVVGVRFFNEATSAINYGYVLMDTTSATGFPATIRRIVYENAGTPITVAIPGANTPPQFAYAPTTGSTVTATGGAGVGSTGTLSITPSIGTAGAGTGAPATTTTTCTAPAAPFAGFAQTVTAVGTGAISGGPLTGTCTVANAAATATLTCSENRGGTAVPVTWTLACPAASQPPLSSNPASGATLTLPPRAVGGPASSANIAFTNPGGAAATVTCTAPAATQFTVAPLVVNVAAGASASTTVSFTSPAIGAFTGTLSCTAGAQTFNFNLAGSTQAQATAVSVPTTDSWAKGLLVLALLGAGLLVTGLRRQH